MRTQTRESIEAYGLASAGLVRGVYEEFVKDPLVEANRSPSKSANLGWAALGLGVLGWDMLAKETLSEGVDRSLEAHRIATYAAVGTVTAHLLNLIPERVDPIHQVAKRTRYHFHPSSH